MKTQWILALVFAVVPSTPALANDGAGFAHTTMAGAVAPLLTEAAREAAAADQVNATVTVRVRVVDTQTGAERIMPLQVANLPTDLIY